MSDNNTLDTTIDEWQAEMARVEEAITGGSQKYLKNGKTLSELQIELNVSYHRIRRLVGILTEKGACEIGRAYRLDLHGIRRLVPVYQLTSEVKAGK